VQRTPELSHLKASDYSQYKQQGKGLNYVMSQRLLYSTSQYADFTKVSLASRMSYSFIVNV